MRSRDPIALVEAAYSGEPSVKVWLSTLATAASAYGVGGGVVCSAIDLRRVQGRVTSSVRTGAPQVVSEAIARVTDGLPPRLVPRVFAPTEFVGNAQWRLRRLSHEVVQPLPPMWALIGGDARRHAVMLSFPAAADQRPSPDDPFPLAASRTLGRVAAHLGSALRLRAEAGLTDAVLSPSGKLLHAEAEARDGGARSALIDAVLASERARGRLRRTDPDEAVKTWSALVAGQWTIVDSVERDGKRLLLARRNPLVGRDVLQLTPAESEVVWLVALGHSNKFVAYELGVPVSTVISRLRSAFRKLGVSNRAQLIRKLGVPSPGD